MKKKPVTQNGNWN